MEALIEKALIARVLSGDATAYGRLVETHKDHVFNLIFRIVQERGWAEELSQDVFIKAYQQLGTFKYKARFSTWIFRIAYNTAISALRKQRLPQQSLNEQQIHIEDESTYADKEALLLLLQKATGQLPAEERALLLLFYTEEKSISEIAQITGHSPANIKVKIHRIRQRLKTIIAKAL